MRTDAVRKVGDRPVEVLRWVPWLDAKVGTPGEKSIPVRFSKER